MKTPAEQTAQAVKIIAALLAVALVAGALILYAQHVQHVRAKGNVDIDCIDRAPDPSTC